MSGSEANGAEKAAAEAPPAGMVIEQHQTPPVILADDEKKLLATLFGDGSQLTVHVSQSGVIHRLRVKLGIEPAS